MKCHSLVTVVLGVMLSLSGIVATQADERAVIDANTERALNWLQSSGRDAARLLDEASGVLVFPDVVTMGFGVGGEFGEGSLLVDGETVDYYATAGKSHGTSPESGFKAEVILFMTDEALVAFRQNHSWKVGDHVQVPVVASLEAALNSREPRVGLIFYEDGLVSHMQLQGDRITRIVR